MFLSYGLLQQSNAITHNYSLTFDGTEISIDAGSDTPENSVLNPDDRFNLTLHTSGNDYWRVDAPFDMFAPATFFVPTPAIRTSTIESIFYLDGTETARVTETDITQERFHIGPNIWALDQGLTFDTISVSYLLSESVNPDTGAQTDTFIRNGGDDIFLHLQADDRPFFTI